MRPGREADVVHMLGHVLALAPELADVFVAGAEGRRETLTPLVLELLDKVRARRQSVVADGVNTP